MSNNVFNTPTDEAVRLASELAQVKDVLRDLLRKVTQLETRAKRTFPGAFPAGAPRHAASPTGESVEATFSPNQAMQLFEELVTRVRDGDAHGAERRLEELPLADLEVLRKELGVPLRARRPSRRAATSAITGRIRESVMLTQHTNRERK